MNRAKHLFNDTFYALEFVIEEQDFIMQNEQDPVKKQNIEHYITGLKIAQSILNMKYILLDEPE